MILKPFLLSWRWCQLSLFLLICSLAWPHCFKALECIINLFIQKNLPNVHGGTIAIHFMLGATFVVYPNFLRLCFQFIFPPLVLVL